MPLNAIASYQANHINLLDSSEIISEALTAIKTGVPPADYIEAFESRFFRDMYGMGAMKFSEWERAKMNHLVSRAGAKWACISAKSQRAKKSPSIESYRYKVQIFDQVTHISPVYERMRPLTVKNRDVGEVIQKFTERSRQRMLSKARKLRKDRMKLRNEAGELEFQERKLPVPYFVTLTYRENMQDCETAKKHLNVFFQRWRRVNKDFAYMWKMEPQKRGAVHFHIAFFEPDGFFPEAWKSHSKKVEFVRMRLGTAWNEINNQAFTDTTGNKCLLDIERFDSGKKCGNVSLFTGTNVRECENWKAFTGYVGSYMKKEIKINPWDGKRTGRFWGFSNNLDFQQLQTGIVEKEELDNLNEFCNLLNVACFRQVTQQLKQNAERAKGHLSGKKLESKLLKLRNTYEAQKRRFKVNQEKIYLGYGLQFEMNGEHAINYKNFLYDKELRQAYPPPDS